MPLSDQEQDTIQKLADALQRAVLVTSRLSRDLDAARQEIAGLHAEIEAMTRMLREFRPQK